MIQALIGFNKGILAMPKPWLGWTILLVSANLVSPWFFLGKLEATVVLVGVMLSLTLMITLYAKYGFVRLLGLGHAPWLLTVPWLWSRLAQAKESELFYYWLLAVVVLDSVSLIIDAVDAIRYWLGERKPTVMADSNAL
jgi:hypothetical protein